MSLIKFELGITFRFSSGTVNYVHKDEFLGHDWWEMLPCAPNITLEDKKNANCTDMLIEKTKARIEGGGAVGLRKVLGEEEGNSTGYFY